MREAEPDYVTAKKQLGAAMDELDLRFSFVYVLQAPAGKRLNELKLVWDYELFKGPRSICTGKFEAGIGHAPSYEQAFSFGSVPKDAYDALVKEVATGRTLVKESRYEKSAPILPDPVDVLGSLLMDSSALDYSKFEHWAQEYGYDADSRKAEAVYRACLETALALRSALGDAKLQELRELAWQL